MNGVMKKGLKKFLSLFMALVFSFALFGCGSSMEEETTESVSEDTEMYTVYYMNSEWTDFAEESIYIDQLESAENIIDKLMNAMIAVGDDTDYQIPVAEGLSYQRYSYDGNGTLTLMFYIDYETAESYRVMLSKMAFTKTLCQIPDVFKIQFQMTDLIGNNEVNISEYTEESFSTIDDDFMESETYIEIYVPDTTGLALKKTEIVIDSYLYTTPEEQVIDALRNSDEWISPVSEDVGVVDVYVENNICYVNFESVENKNADFFNNKVYIYSVVDSLVSLESVSSVVFTVQGSRDVSYGEILDFSKTYTADYSYCEE